MSHFSTPSACRLSQSATFKKVFEPIIFKITDSLYSNLPEDTIGEKIKKLRLKYNITQLQFARSIHRGFGTVTKWEQEITTPSNNTLSDIVTIYNLDENYFDLYK